MYKYVLKRILLLVPIMLIVTFITFSILSLTHGDPGTIILGRDAPPEAIEELNHKLGYDKPYLARYVDYIKNAIKGDFGESYMTRQPVFEEIFPRFPYTLRLDIYAIILAMLIGIPLGVLSAVKQYSFFDYLGTSLAMIMATIPGFWLGLLLMLLFSLKLDLLPSSGVGTIYHYIMPALTLAIPCSASILRMTRTTMLEVIRQDYIRTARSKGAPERTVIWGHALRNALLPVATIIMMSFGQLLGGTVLVETIFAMPGVGSMVVEAIRMKDVPLVMGSVIFLSSLFTIIMLLMDLAYAIFDPRIKSRYVKH